MKVLTRCIANLVLLLWVSNCLAQYPISVNVTIMPPISPYISQLINDPGSNINAIINYNGFPSGNYKVKLCGKIERIAPGPFTITLSPDYRPAFPLLVGQNQPSLYLTKPMIENAFGNIAESNLIVSGISLAELKKEYNYKLPEGQYKICLIAYDYDAPGFSRPLSDPNSGCAYFNVCYKASPPQITQPVSEFAQQQEVKLISSSTPVTFTWTPAVAPCAQMFTGLNYTLELFKLFPGQVATDAVNNPNIFMKTGLIDPEFILDTLLYPSVLQVGQQYVVRARATIPQNNNGLEIDNNGYSRPLAFQYDSVVTSPIAIRSSSHPLPGICPDIPTVNTTTIPTTDNLANANVTIGAFSMRITNISSSTNGLSGTGIINWTPVANHTIPLSVIFQNLQISGSNGTYQVFQGDATTVVNPNASAFVNSTVWSNANDLLSHNTNAFQINNFLSQNQSSQFATQFIDQITTTNPVTLPLGINKQIDGTNAYLTITGISFSPDGTNMNVLYNLNITEANGWLSLGGTNFCIKPDGFSFDKALLYLPTDQSFDFSSQTKLSFQHANLPVTSATDTAKGTYLIWDERGLNSIHATANLAFPNTTLVPDDGSGNIITGSPEVATLTFDFKTWENWIANVTLPPFQLPNLPNFTISTTGGQVYYDHSPSSNPAQMSFPTSYTHDSTLAFEGIYIPKMKVTLPPSLTNLGNNSAPKTFTSSNLVIDMPEGLVSSVITGKNIIDLKTGLLGGWRFSLNKIKALVIDNNLDSASFSGAIQLPISNDSLSYSADLHSSGNSTTDPYDFVVSTPKNGSYKVDLWAAEMTLDPNTSIVIKADANTAPTITAKINATLNLDPGASPDLPVNLLSLKCQNMTVANTGGTNGSKFKFDPGKWSFDGIKFSGADSSSKNNALKDSSTNNTANSQQNIMGFPISLNAVDPYFQLVGEGNNLNAKVGMTFSIGVDIVDIVKGAAKLSLYGTVKNVATGPMEPDNSPVLQCDSIIIDTAKLGPVTISGAVGFLYNDATWGNCVSGNLKAVFTQPADVEISAVALFGKREGMNFWFVDANATFPAIPVGIAIGLSGLGGGAYYNLAVQDTSQLPKSNALGKPVNNSGAKTLSGLNYKPQSGSFGFMATTEWAVLDFEAACNFDATINIDWGSSRVISVLGNAYFMDWNYPDHSQAVISSSLVASYDINNNIFDGGIDTKMKVPEIDFIKADFPIKVHDEANLWYIKIGDPFDVKNRVRFDLKTKGNVAKVVTWDIGLDANGYMAAGTFLKDGLPSLPKDVTDNLTAIGATDARAPVAAPFAIPPKQGNGNLGFLMGADVVGHFDVTAGPFYMDDSADVGFDVALLHNGTTCDGNLAGWNGWYANGQLYAYLQGEAGIVVDVWAYKGKIALLDIGAAALLQVGLPDPNWAQGEVHIWGSALDGMIKVNDQFKFKVGEACVNTGNPLALDNIISSCGPNGSKVDVYENVYATMSLPMDSFFLAIPNSNHPTSNTVIGDTETAQFLFTLDSFSLTDNTLNRQVATTVETGDNLTFDLVRNETLLSNNSYTVYLRIKAQQKINGKWSIPWDYSNGKAGTVPLYKDTSWTFKAGTAPTYLPEEQVLNSVPVNKQRYFLPGSFPQGVIKPSYWDANNIGSSVNQNYLLYFIPISGGDTIKTVFNPDYSKTELLFSIPGSLKSKTIYRTEFWINPKDLYAFSNYNTGISNTTNKTTTMVTYNQVSADTGIKLRNLTATVAKMKPRTPYYTLYFGTSSYTTLEDKIKSFGTRSGDLTCSFNNIDVIIGTSNPGEEFFDDCEVKSYQNAYCKSKHLNLPPLLNITVYPDYNAESEKSYYHDITLNIQNLMRNDLRIDLGNNILRDGSNLLPLPPVSFSNSDPMLSPGDCDPFQHNYQSQLSTGNNSGSGPTGNTRMVLPNNTNSSDGSGFRKMQVSNSFGPNQITWNIDKYVMQDYQTMRDIGYNYVPYKNGFSGTICSPFFGIDNIDLSGDNDAGHTTIPSYYLCSLSKNAAVSQVIQNLQLLQFKPFPHSGVSRRIEFSYAYGDLNMPSANFKTLTSKNYTTFFVTPDNTSVPVNSPTNNSSQNSGTLNRTH